MSVFVRNFANSETQVLTATTGGAVATFTTEAGKKARDLRIVNTGATGAWVLPVASNSTLAPNTAAANSTAAFWLAPGEDVVLRKQGTTYLPFVAATSDSGSPVILIMAGKGS